MPESIWKNIPYAIYIDTNGLLAAGPYLNSQWINELLSITNELKINVCISELVLSEWCEHILNDLQNSRRLLLSEINLLKHFGISVPEIKADEIIIPERNALHETLSLKLNKLGFQIVQNCDISLAVLLNEAVSKRAPFENRGKGFCDVVILESFIKHAKDNFPGSKIFVVSTDKAVKRSGERFEKQGIIVDFCDYFEIVEKLKSVLKDAISAYVETKKERLKDFIKEHEKEIFDFIEKSPLEISDFMLHVMKRDKEEKIEGSIEKIYSIRPIEIFDAIGGIPKPGRTYPNDRYPIMILIEIELSVIIRQYGSNLLFQPRVVVQPNTIDISSPAILKNIDGNEPQEIIRTIKRYTGVYATIDADKEKKDIFEDFRIEEI